MQVQDARQDAFRMRLEIGGVGQVKGLGVGLSINDLRQGTEQDLVGHGHSVGRAEESLHQDLRCTARWCGFDAQFGRDAFLKLE